MNLEDAKILIVEDDDVMRMFVTNILMQLGVRQVQDATDGQEGLLKVANFRPDVIVSDIHMGPVDGLDFVKQLRAHPVIELRNTPVLILSADKSYQAHNHSVLLGVIDYIIKPPNQESLKIKLNNALRFR